MRATALPRSLLLLAGVLFASGASLASRTGQTATAGGWVTLAGEHRDTRAADVFLARLMSEHRVSALSVSVIQDGRAAFSRTLGVVSPASGARADGRTVFGAASLSKPVFAYLVMKLVDERVLELDTPISRYLDRPLHEREKVFVPLGMADTSFLWEPRFDGRFAVDLESPLARLIQRTRKTANAAGSLVTHAADYARFVAAVMTGEGLSPAARAAMVEPRVALTSRSLFSAPGTDDGANRQHAMAWTAGWGTFKDQRGRAFFHVGMEEGCENFVELFPERRQGIVFFSLTSLSRSFSAALVDYALGPGFSPLTWLEYGDRAPAAGGE